MTPSLKALLAWGHPARVDLPRLVFLSELTVCLCLNPWPPGTLAALQACVHACALSCVQLFVTPWTVALQAPLSMRFSRQESWSGCPFPPAGDLPDPGIEPGLPALAGGFFNTEVPGKPSFRLLALMLLPEKQHSVSLLLASVPCY